MATLLLSLGTSWAIVPEAFLFPDIEFDQVHVLTTESPRIETGLVREWFARHAPHVQLSITRVQGFAELRDEADHFLFEETLARWLLAHSRHDPPHICLAGGFKSMSAAVQRAATVFGAREVFHVLCNGDPPPGNAEEIQSALEAQRLQWIRLGGEPGWPQFKHLTPDAYPLLLTPLPDGCLSAHAPDQQLRHTVARVMEESRRIAASWDHLAALPFPVLATLSHEARAWLEEPLDVARDHDWLRALPKIDLHSHLGGFATDGPLLEEVRAAAAEPARLPRLIQPAPPAGWPLPPEPCGLQPYCALGDASGSTLLRDPGCLRRHCELFYRELEADGVLYAEIRCSPANYTRDDRSPWDVLQQVKQVFDDCRRGSRVAHPPQVHLIIIATRREAGDFRAFMARHLALAVTAAEHWRTRGECRVVGVDLAGYEVAETRAHYFREEFTAIHRCGLALTVHAGENDDAEAIWRAVFDLNARRIGHGLHLHQSADLMRSMAARRIAVEMCPYANYQIKGFALDGEVPCDERPIYPLQQYLNAGIPVTVNTDNLGISAASLSDNLLLAARLCPGLTRLQILWLLRHAVDAVFVDAGERALLLARMNAGVAALFSGNNGDL